MNIVGCTDITHNITGLNRNGVDRMGHTESRHFCIGNIEYNVLDVSLNAGGHTRSARAGSL